MEALRVYASPIVPYVVIGFEKRFQVILGNVKLNFLKQIIKYNRHNNQS